LIFNHIEKRNKNTSYKLAPVRGTSEKFASARKTQIILKCLKGGNTVIRKFY